MPGWRKSLMLEVRDGSHPGVLFVTKFVTDDFSPTFRSLFFERKKTPKTLFLKFSAPLPSSRSDRI